MHRDVVRLIMTNSHTRRLPGSQELAVAFVSKEFRQAGKILLAALLFTVGIVLGGIIATLLGLLARGLQGRFRVRRWLPLGRAKAPQGWRHSVRALQVPWGHKHPKSERTRRAPGFATHAPLYGDSWPGHCRFEGGLPRAGTGAILDR